MDKEVEYFKFLADPLNDKDYEDTLFCKLKEGFKIISAVSYEEDVDDMAYHNGNSYKVGSNRYPKICYILARDPMGRLVYG